MYISKKEILFFSSKYDQNNPRSRKKPLETCGQKPSKKICEGVAGLNCRFEACYIIKSGAL